MCTSLLYHDAANRAYLGRTLELSLELPYQIALFPKGQALSSTVAGHPALKWETSHAIIAVTMPADPHAGANPDNFKIVEGMNDAGLTFSVQSYPHVSGPQTPVDGARAALSAVDLGTWVLGQFSTVAQVKAALAETPVVVEPVAILGGQEMPFHYSLHDPSGASLVIEFHKGVRTVHDNPVGVMTNGPQFDWHLTNLNNYTFLNNVDRASTTFGSFKAVQPDSGSAKIGLPGTDTSVDRFIRAVYFAEFAEKQEDPDKAVEMVAHIMNNFDRPRGISIDPTSQGIGYVQETGQGEAPPPTEYTSWTNISDLDRRIFFLRNGAGMNYIGLNLKDMAGTTQFSATPMARLTPSMPKIISTLAAE